jgi:hypothetical protein
VQPPAHQLDIVTVAIVFATWLFGPATAEIVGPYAVIFVGAVGGASWAAARRPPDSRAKTLRFIAWMVGLAVMTTVPVAEMFGRWFGIEARWMFAPVAVVIAARPDWVFGWAQRLIERRFGGEERRP